MNAISQMLKDANRETLSSQKKVIAEPLPAPEVVKKQPKKILVGIYLTPEFVKQVKKISYETGQKANSIYEKLLEVGMNYKQY